MNVFKSSAQNDSTSRTLVYLMRYMKCRRRKGDSIVATGAGGAFVTFFLIIVLLVAFLVFFSFCFCFPFFLILGGIVSFSVTSDRGSKISEINDGIEEWQDQYLDLMKGIDSEGFNVEFDDDSPIVNFEEDTTLEIDVDGIRSGLDSTSIGEWDVYYFSWDHEKGNIDFDASIPSESSTFIFSEDSDTQPSIETTYFVETYTDENEYYCDLNDGYWMDADVVSDETCRYRYVLERVCVVIDESTMSFSKVEDGQNGYGCFYNQSFYGGDDVENTALRYEIVSSSTFSGYTVKYEIRSKHDPEIIIDYVSEGTYDLGTPYMVSVITGLSLLGTGFCFCLPCFLICCLAICGIAISMILGLCSCFLSAGGASVGLMRGRNTTKIVPKKSSGSDDRKSASSSSSSSSSSNDEEEVGEIAGLNIGSQQDVIIPPSSGQMMMQQNNNIHEAVAVDGYIQPQQQPFQNPGFVTVQQQPMINFQGNNNINNLNEPPIMGMDGGTIDYNSGGGGGGVNYLQSVSQPQKDHGF